jgi:hypothetical protein
VSRSSKPCIVGSLLSRLSLSCGNDPFNAIALGVDHYHDNRPYSTKDSEAIFAIVSVVLGFDPIRIVEYATGILKTYSLVLALVLKILFRVPIAS